MIAALPSGQRRRESAVVSLVDLFPTILDLAGLDRPGHRLDGHSFAEATHRPLADSDGLAVCEYCAEGQNQPMRFIRRGKHKYVHVPECPPLLFDLSADPNERDNLAGRADLADVEQSLRQQLLADWDPAAVRRRVLASQAERLMISQALRTGQQLYWDFPPGPVYR
jgi:choline-sulfatase